MKQRAICFLIENCVLDNTFLAFPVYFERFCFILENRKKLASVAAGVNIETTFEKTLPYSHQFRLSQTDLVKMNEIRQQQVKKLKDRRMRSLGLTPDSPLPLTRRKQSITKHSSVVVRSTNNDSNYVHRTGNDVRGYRKVDIEYFNTLLPYLKRYNPACALCIKSRYFGKNVSNPTHLLVKCLLKCSGKDCYFKCTVYIRNNGYGFIVASSRQVFHHVSERLSRPIRGSQRELIKDKFRSDASVYRIHAQYDKKRTADEKKGFNYDTTGKSRKIFKKIKAEAVAESLLSPDVITSIAQLHDALAKEINPKGIVKGAIQVIQLRPFFVVAFMEASIRLYDAIVSHPESVLSWDATGGIVKNTMSMSKQCLYYELTVSHPNIVDEDTLIPLAFMLSETQTLETVIGWLRTFKERHGKVCEFFYQLEDKKIVCVEKQLPPIISTLFPPLIV